MKDVLSHLHNAMDTEQDNYRFDTNDIMDNLDTLDQNSNSSNGKWMNVSLVGLSSLCCSDCVGADVQCILLHKTAQNSLTTSLPRNQ